MDIEASRKGASLPERLQIINTIRRANRLLHAAFTIYREAKRNGPRRGK